MAPTEQITRTLHAHTPAGYFECENRWSLIAEAFPRARCTPLNRSDEYEWNHWGNMWETESSAARQDWPEYSEKM